MLSHRKKLRNVRVTGAVSHRGRGLTPPAPPIVPLPAQPTMWLRTAPDIVYPPPIDRTSYAIVRATDFPDADTMFAFYPNVLDYLLVIDGGGDFMSWGSWVVHNRSGTSGRYRTIRFFNVTDDHLHPYNRIGGNEVLVEGIQFNGTSSYWMVCGLTQRNRSALNDVRDTAHHIVYSRFLVQAQTNVDGFKIRGGDGCIVQQSVLIDPAVPGTTGLVGLSLDPNEGPVSGYKALDNEVRNYKDGLLVGYNPVDGFTEIDILSEGNDYYNDESYFDANGAGPFENGIDIKGSSSSVQSVSRRDRIRNMRRCSSSNGDAIEIHKWARNWLFDEVFIDNAEYGFFETAWAAPIDPNTPRNIVFRGCQFSRIDAYAAAPITGGGGSVFRCINNLDVADCWFANSNGVVWVATTPRAGGPVFNNNTRINTETYVSGTVTEPYIEANNSVGDPSAVPQLIQCNRWTGPIFVYGARLNAPLEDREPVAAFDVTLVGALVQATDASVAYDATIVSYDYDWGDGTAHSSSASPSHTYTANGPYTIDLTVTDSNGLTHRTQRNVFVTDLPDVQMPIYEGYGTVLKTTSGGSPGLPAGVVEHDLLIAVTVSQGTEPVTASAAQGYTQVTGSPVDVGLASGSALGVWWRRVGSRAAGQPDETDAALIPVWNDPGNHLMSLIFRIRRASRSGDPFEAVSSNFIISSTVDVEIPGGTTTAANRLIMAMCTTGADTDAGSFSNWVSTAPVLTSFTERFNEGTSQGNGSGLGVVTGERINQGAFGPITALLSVLFRQARMVLAIKGQEP